MSPAAVLDDPPTDAMTKWPESAGAGTQGSFDKWRVLR